MAEKNDTIPATAVAPEHDHTDLENSNDDWNARESKLMRFYSHPWTQIILVSVIFFCLPGVRLHPLCCLSYQFHC